MHEPDAIAQWILCERCGGLTGAFVWQQYLEMYDCPTVIGQWGDLLETHGMCECDSDEPGMVS